jgi:methyl-accepting chemotaxis protein
MESEFDAEMRSYEALVTPGRKQDMANAIAKSWQDYRAFSDSFLVFFAKGDMAAASMAIEKSNPAMNDFRKILQDDITYNAECGTQAAEAGQRLASSTQAMIAGTLGCAVLVCILIGLALIRGISGPIAMMTAAMRRLAAHDLDVIVPP